MGTLRVSRQELYDLVWREPSTQLAKRLKVSDVSIGKACTSLGIPKPPPGYWAQLKAGKAPERPRLPARKGHQRDWYEFWDTREQYKHRPLGRAPGGRPSKAATRRRARQSGKVPVATSLDGASPAIRRAFASLDETYGSEFGVLQGRLQGFVDIRTTPELALRALLILDAVERASGQPLIVDREKKCTGIQLDEFLIAVWVRERTTRVDYNPDIHPGPSWSTRRYWQEPTAELELHFKHPCLEGKRRVWRDREGLSVEAQLGEAVETVKELPADAERYRELMEARRLEREREHEEWGRQQLIKQRSELRLQLLDEKAKVADEMRQLSALISEWESTDDDTGRIKDWIDFARGRLAALRERVGLLPPFATPEEHFEWVRIN